MLLCLYVLMALALVFVSIIDFYTFKIPSCLNIFIGILGLIRMGIDADCRWDAIAGFFSVSLFLGIVYIVTKGKSIGGGDIKLMAVSGLMLGWQRNILAFFIGALLALMIHPFRIFFAGAGRRLAFGPYLAGGILISMLWGGPILSAYLQWPGLSFFMFL